MNHAHRDAQMLCSLSQASIKPFHKEHNFLLCSDLRANESKHILKKLEEFSIENFIGDPFVYSNISIADPNLKVLSSDFQRIFPGLNPEKQLMVNQYCLLLCMHAARCENRKIFVSEQQYSNLDMLYNQLPNSVKDYLNKNTFAARDNKVFEVEDKNTIATDQQETPQADVTDTYNSMSNQSYDYKSPCALKNFGNTCYINAIIQVFWNTPEIRNFFLAYKIPTNNASSSIVAHIALLFKAIYSQENIADERMLHDFCNKIKAFGSFGMQQQDVHELYVKLIAAMREIDAFNTINDATDKATIPFCDFLIKTRTSSSYEINAELHEDATLEPIFSIGIPVDYTKQLSIKDILDRYFAQDKIEEAQRIQQLFIDKKQLPSYLGIQIKRFDGTSKNLMPLEIPEILNMRPYCLESTEDIYYSLYAIVVHDGLLLNNGHYYTYIKNQDGWYCCNDDSITPASITEILFPKQASEQTPYLVFYKKTQNIPLTTQRPASASPEVSLSSKESNNSSKPNYNTVLECLQNIKKQNSNHFNSIIIMDLFGSFNSSGKSLVFDAAIKLFELSKDGNYLFYSIDNQQIYIYDIKNEIAPKCIIDVNKYSYAYNGDERFDCIKCSHDGKYLYVGASVPGKSSDGYKILVYHCPATGVATCVERLSGHRGHITQLKLSRDGHNLFSCATDKSIRIWNVGKPSIASKQGFETIAGIAGDTFKLSKNGEKLIYNKICAGGKCFLGLNDIKSLSRTLWEAEPNKFCFCSTLVQSSKNYKFLYAGCSNNGIKILQISDSWNQMQHVGELKKQGKLQSLKLVKDDMYLISSSDDKKIEIWDVTQPQQAKSIKTLEGCAFAVTKNGNYLFVADDRDRIVVWDIKNPAQFIRLGSIDSGHSGQVKLKISKNGNSLILIADNTIKIWDIAIFNISDDISAEHAGVILLALAAKCRNGKYDISCDSYKTIIYDSYTTLPTKIQELIKPYFIMPNNVISCDDTFERVAEKSMDKLVSLVPLLNDPSVREKIKETAKFLLQNPIDWNKISAIQSSNPVISNQKLPKLTDMLTILFEEDQNNEPQENLNFDGYPKEVLNAIKELSDQYHEIFKDNDLKKFDQLLAQHKNKCLDKTLLPFFDDFRSKYILLVKESDDNVNFDGYSKEVLKVIKEFANQYHESIADDDFKKLDQLFAEYKNQFTNTEMLTFFDEARVQVKRFVSNRHKKKDLNK